MDLKTIEKTGKKVAPNKRISLGRAEVTNIGTKETMMTVSDPVQKEYKLGKRSMSVPKGRESLSVTKHS